MAIINEEKVREVVKDIVEIFTKHKLTKEEMFYMAQRLYGETKLMTIRSRQRRDAEDLVGDMVRKFAPGFGGRKT